jgi:hypothetical protein
MSNRAKWAILEDNWPQSINQAVDWITLRKGECSYQDQVSFDRDGAMKYSDAPSASPSFIQRRFIPPDAPDEPGDQWCRRVWAYSRWWRINPDKKYRWEYSDLGQADSAEFVAVGYDDFNQDGNGDIRLVVPDGEGKWFILKDTCGYTLSNANGGTDSFKKSSAYFGIGNSNSDSWYSNSVITGNVLTMWNCGGATPIRHFMWDGSNGAAELSRNVRELAGAQSEIRVSVDWAQNLVIAGKLVYDLDLKRVYYFSGAATGSYTSRAYHHIQYNPVTVYKFAFITTGTVGSFTAIMEYGQAEDDLQKTKEFKVNVTSEPKNRFRHVWELRVPVTCRVFRLKITGLTGTGISQIESLSETSENVESMDDSK